MQGSATPVQQPSERPIEQLDRALHVTRERIDRIGMCLMIPVAFLVAAALLESSPTMQLVSAGLAIVVALAWSLAQSWATRRYERSALGIADARTSHLRFEVTSLSGARLSRSRVPYAQLEREELAQSHRAHVRSLIIGETAIVSLSGVRAVVTRTADAQQYAKGRS